MITRKDSSRRGLDDVGATLIQAIDKELTLHIIEWQSKEIDVKMELLRSVQISQQIALIRRFPRCLKEGAPYLTPKDQVSYRVVSGTKLKSAAKCAQMNAAKGQQIKRWFDTFTAALQRTQVLVEIWLHLLLAKFF